MSPSRLGCVVLLMSLTGTAYTQSSSPPAESAERVENGVPITRLIATVAKKTGKKFVVDLRVHGEAELVGQDAATVNYAELLTILHMYGYTAVEYGGYVNVIPDAGARALPAPILTGKETFPDTEYVSTIISVKNVPVADLVPILRPLIPQNGHLAALPCVNKLIMADTFGNIRRIETLIASLDVGEPYKPQKCEPRSPT